MRRILGLLALAAGPVLVLGVLFVLPVMVLWAAGAMIVLALLRRRPAFRERPAIVQGILPVAPALLMIIAFVFI